MRLARPAFCNIANPTINTSAMGSAYTKSPHPAFFRILSVERLYPCGWRTFVNSSAIVSGVLSPKFPVTSTECVARLDFAFVTYGTSVSSLSVIKIHALQCIPLTWNVYVFCSDSGMGRTILPHPSLNRGFFRPAVVVRQNEFGDFLGINGIE